MFVHLFWSVNLLWIDFVYIQCGINEFILHSTNKLNYELFKYLVHRALKSEKCSKYALNVQNSFFVRGTINVPRAQRSICDQQWSNAWDVLIFILSAECEQSYRKIYCVSWVRVQRWLIEIYDLNHDFERFRFWTRFETFENLEISYWNAFFASNLNHYFCSTLL